MKKLRLLVTANCMNACEGCCNNEWDLLSLPVHKAWSHYDEIYITGGEPTLYKSNLTQLISEIREWSRAKIFVYTANPSPDTLTWLAQQLDGITLTFHQDKDVVEFNTGKVYTHNPISLRLNIFTDVKMIPVNLYGWSVKFIQWIKDCPVPDNEEFCRLDKLWS